MRGIKLEDRTDIPSIDEFQELVIKIPLHKLASKYKISKDRLKQYLEDNGVKIPERNHYLIKDRVGQRFGKLVVLKYISVKKFLCECDCGVIKEVGKPGLLKGTVISCGCYKKDKETSSIDKIIRKCKYSAKVRNIAYDDNVTKEFLNNLLISQENKCAITNLPIVISNNKNLSEYAVENTASIDRIDSSKGYIPDNVQWVHKDINRLKLDYTMDELIIFARHITRKFKNTNVGKPFGYIYCLDCYGVDSLKLDSSEFLYQFLEDLVVYLGVNKQADAVIFKTPNDERYEHGEGYTGYIPLIQSGISFHSMPSKQFISIDVYTCCEMDTEKVKKFVLNRFNFSRCDEEFIERGLGYYGIKTLKSV